MTQHLVNLPALCTAAPAEVLRQQAIAAGAGGTRVPLKRLTATAATAEGAEGANAGNTKGAKGAGRVPKGSVGYEAEDVVSGWTGDGPLKLLLPLRFGETTWMAAAWKVLSEVGAEGLGVTEVRLSGFVSGLGSGVAITLWAAAITGNEGKLGLVTFRGSGPCERGCEMGCHVAQCQTDGYVVPCAHLVGREVIHTEYVAPCLMQLYLQTA